MDGLPRFKAARSVAPDPANGSAITPEGTFLSTDSISDTGLGVGCAGLDAGLYFGVLRTPDEIEGLPPSLARPPDGRLGQLPPT